MKNHADLWSLVFVASLLTASFSFTHGAERVSNIVNLETAPGTPPIRAKRKYEKQEPLREKFDTDKEFRTAKKDWSKKRSRNNKAVRKYRARKAHSTKQSPVKEATVPQKKKRVPIQASKVEEKRCPDPSIVTEVAEADTSLLTFEQFLQQSIAPHALCNEISLKDEQQIAMLARLLQMQPDIQH